MKVLIVVDMLNDFCHEDGILAKSIITGEYYAKPIIPNIMKKIATYRQDKAIIIYLCDAHAPDDEEFKRFPPHCVKDTWGARIIEELNPALIHSSNNEMVIEKTRYSGFYNTTLNYVIQAMKASFMSFEVVGVCSSICVMDTVGGLANRDYDIVVDGGCIADFDPEMHEMSLKRMENLYGVKIIGE